MGWDRKRQQVGDIAYFFFNENGQKSTFQHRTVISWTQNDQICLPSLFHDCPWKLLGIFFKTSKDRAAAEQIWSLFGHSIPIHMNLFLSNKIYTNFKHKISIQFLIFADFIWSQQILSWIPLWFKIVFAVFERDLVSDYPLNFWKVVITIPNCLLEWVQIVKANV